jgi:hypothetical protein
VACEYCGNPEEQHEMCKGCGRAYREGYANGQRELERALHGTIGWAVGMVQRSLRVKRPSWGTVWRKGLEPYLRMDDLAATDWELVE